MITKNKSIKIKINLYSYGIDCCFKKIASVDKEELSDVLRSRFIK